LVGFFLQEHLEKENLKKQLLLLTRFDNQGSNKNSDLFFSYFTFKNN